MPAKIEFIDPLDSFSLHIDGKRFPAIVDAALALNPEDHPELNRIFAVFCAGVQQIAFDANKERDSLKDVAVQLQSERDALKAQLDDALASAKATADELTQARADAKKAALDAKESREAAIADLTEQLRIAKLPPADQKKLELEAQMAQAEKFLAAAKAEHAALLDPA